MNKSTYEMISRLTALGINSDDAWHLRRIAMTLHRWHELECGDGNPYGSWWITRGRDRVRAKGGTKMKPSNKIKRIYTRHYSDSGQTTACVEWQDGACTEGPADDYHGVLVPRGAHMGALFDRAIANGLTVEREVW